MAKPFKFLWFVALLLPACTADGSVDQSSMAINDPATEMEIETQEPDLPPQYYMVELGGVLAGPGKVDGTPWDGTGTLAETLVNLAANFTQNPILETKEVLDLARQIEQALAKPDITAEVSVDFGFGTMTETRILDEDNFMPIFRDPVYLGDTYHGAPSIQFGSARLVFIDRDLANDDTMGAIRVSQEDIELIISEGDGKWLNVADQTNGQILAVQVYLTPIDGPDLL